MPTPTAPASLRWFIFRHGSSVLGSFSRTEGEALADVRQRILKRAKKGSTAEPELTRDTEAEAKANDILFGRVKGPSF